MVFAMALRARLRETNDSFAAVAYDALLKPWSVTSGHTDGDAFDKSLSIDGSPQDSVPGLEVQLQHILLESRDLP